MTSQQTKIQTTCGAVEKKNGVWFFMPDAEKENHYRIPFSDHWTVDTYVVPYNGKYGVFSLPNMSDYGNNDDLKWKSLNEAPFPYDEVRFIGMSVGYFGLMAYRINSQWGIDYFYYVSVGDCVQKKMLVPCEYASLEEAQTAAFIWKQIQ